MKKSSLDNTVKTKEEKPPGLFPPTKPKVNNVYNENFRDFNEEQLINEVNDDDIVFRWIKQQGSFEHFGSMRGSSRENENI